MRSPRTPVDQRRAERAGGRDDRPAPVLAPAEPAVGRRRHGAATVKPCAARVVLSTRVMRGRPAAEAGATACSCEVVDPEHRRRPRTSRRTGADRRTTVGWFVGRVRLVGRRWAAIEALIERTRPVSSAARGAGVGRADRASTRAQRGGLPPRRASVLDLSAPVDRRLRPGGSLQPPCGAAWSRRSRRQPRDGVRAAADRDEQRDEGDDHRGRRTKTSHHRNPPVRD